MPLEDVIGLRRQRLDRAVLKGSSVLREVSGLLGGTDPDVTAVGPQGIAARVGDMVSSMRSSFLLW
jgi:hypothetical protein